MIQIQKTDFYTASESERQEKRQVVYRADNGAWQSKTVTRNLPPVPERADSSGSYSNTAVNENGASAAAGNPMKAKKAARRG